VTSYLTVRVCSATLKEKRISKIKVSVGGIDGLVQISVEGTRPACNNNNNNC
jgi:hypothetical protein